MNYLFIFGIKKMLDKSILITLFIVILLNITGLFERLDNYFYDSLILLNQQKSTNPDIVIVEIDNKSIKQIGYWPFKRSLYAKALEKIISASPAVIGIDLSFTITQGDKKEDDQLYKVLRSFKNLVLATKFDHKQIQKFNLLLPEKSLFPEIAKGHILLNEKEVIRTLPPYKVIPAFSLQILKMYYNSSPSLIVSNKLKSFLFPPNKYNYSISDEMLIDYKRKASKYKHISFIDLIDDKADLSVLRNKIVLLGVTDTYYTPYYVSPFNIDKTEPANPSVKIQAQIIESLIHYRNLKEVPFAIMMLISIFIAVSYYLLSKKKSFIAQGFSFFILFLLIIFSDYILFKFLNVWFPPINLLTLITFIFGFYIYFTVNKIDEDIVQTIHRLSCDDNIFMEKLPTEIFDKVALFKNLVETISKDRQTIKTVINGVNNGIVVFDKTGKIIWTNGSFLNLYNNSLVLNCNITELLKDIDLETLKKETESNKSYTIELSINDRYFQTIINPISENNSDYIMIMNDITELKKNENLRTDMFRMLGHEIKNPLLSISIASEELIDQGKESIVTQHSKIIYESSIMISNLIKDFLNLNKLESKLINPALEKTCMNELVAEIVDQQKVAATHKNISIKINSNNPEIYSLIDKKLMSIVLNNLISNAVKYSDSDTEVNINIDLQNFSIITSIVDQGIGIPEREIDLIFNKFYRASNSSKYDIYGTGLGLSIVKTILDLHHSEITVSSQPGRGTTFTFILKAIN